MKAGLFIILVACFSNAVGGTYYFAASGNDRNSGLSPQAPKQSLAAASELAVSGNVLLFRRGDCWYDPFSSFDLSSKGGEAGAPVVINAYGEGPKPVIAGLFRLSDEKWERITGTTTWKQEVTGFSAAFRLFMEGVSKYRVNTTDSIANEVSVNQPHEWYMKSVTHNRAVIYVNTGSSAKAPKDVEVIPHGSKEAMVMKHTRHVVVRNIDFRGGSQGRVIYIEAPSSDITIDSCIIQRGNGSGIMAENDARGDLRPFVSNIQILNCLIDKTWSSHENDPGILLSGDDIFFRHAVDGGLIRGNTIRNWGHSGISLTSYELGVHGVHRIIVELNDVSAGASAYMHGIDMNGFDGLTTHNIIRRNYFHDYNVTGHILGSYNQIYSNIFAGVKVTKMPRHSHQGWGADWFVWRYRGTGPWIEAHDNYLVNNTFADTEEYALMIGDYPDNPDPVRNNVIANNIFYNFGQLAINTNDNIRDVMPIENNNFWHRDRTESVVRLNGTAFSAAELNSALPESIRHNIQFDPFFADPGQRDFRLTAATPEAVKSGGTNTYSALFGNDFVDYFGNPWDPVNPSIGAIQWNPAEDVRYPKPVSQVNEVDVPVPPGGHPRLLFRKADIPMLKNRLAHPQWKAYWDQVLAASRRKTNGMLQPDKVHNLNHDVQGTIEARALLYAFGHGTDMGRSAVDALLHFYRTLRVDLKRHDVCRDVGRAILTGALVYDWCYDLISADSKRILISHMEKLAIDGLEVKWPLLVQGSVTGHGSEAQLARDMLACGIATYDEKPEIYRLVAGRILKEFVPARRFFYPAGYHHQGSSYGPYRYLWDMWATVLFDRMGYPNLFGPDQAQVPYRFIYLRRPDGQLLRDGDDFIEGQVPFGTYWQTPGIGMAGSYFKDPILVGETHKQQQTAAKKGDYLFDYLLLDPEVPSDPDKSSLPLTRYFGEPLGAMIARTGWEEGIHSNTVVAEMKVGNYSFGNHQHLDAGSFQLYYKGPLAPESGVYEGGNGAYGSEHFKHYYQRTIAHNAMLIYNPDEHFTWQGRAIANDGGQLYRNGGREPANLDALIQNGYETSKVLAHGFGPDSLRPAFSYLKGDLAPAYTDKVSSFTRSFVFLNTDDKEIPAALIVFDRIGASDTAFRKYWLLHTVEEPRVGENTISVMRSEKGYNGKMINTTLLPHADNLHIDKVGGPGREYDVFGNNYAQPFRNPGQNSYDSASWRVQLSPRKPNAADCFLNVMQVMDAGTNLPPWMTPEKVETGELVGAKLGTTTVYFAKQEAALREKFQVIVRGPSTQYILLTDLADRRWKVIAKSSKSTAVIRQQGRDYLYFEANEGKYTITYD